MQSTVSVLMAAIVFIVEFFSGILSSASDREPAKPYKPDKPAVSSTLTVFSRNDEFSDLVGKYQPEGARLNFVSEYRNMAGAVRRWISSSATALKFADSWTAYCR